MTYRRTSRPIWGLGLLIGLVATAPADAAWLGIRNDTGVPIYVQGGSIVNNVVRKGKAYLLQPGQVLWDMTTPGLKSLTIYDPKQPGQILFDDKFIAGQVDLFFSIQADVQVMPGGVRVPRIRIMPMMAPTPPPRLPMR